VLSDRKEIEAFHWHDIRDNNVHPKILLYIRHIFFYRE
jgi:hypothetical protein